jgi:glycosyltransferase involved in cell wall biosynthesis
MAPRFSVVVPTHDRIDVLPEVLAALERQVGAPEFEVGVVDDGSTDGTADFLDGWRREMALRVVRQPASGPARARNAGVREASGERVAFLGDDTVPEPGWLAAHARAHAERSGASLLGVIGHTRWHRRQRLNPFLRYINDYGLQFGYALIRDRERVPFNFLYTSNLSLPRAALLADPFDERFPFPAWEDIELGYRLQQKGLRLVYEPRAVVAHDHPTDLRRFAERHERAGYSAVVFYQRHPELGSFLGLAPEGPPPLPPAGRQRLQEALVRGLQNWPVRLPRLWESVLRYHYIQGLQRGWRERMREGQGETS